VYPTPRTQSLATQPKSPLLQWHDRQSNPVGVAESGDDRHDGLHATFRLGPSPAGQVAGYYAREMDMGLSIAFIPVESSWNYATEWDPDRGADHMDQVTRTMGRLVEVSLVATPA
jgi:hypothetical protein